ncbi:hypothetical protein GCM10010495_77700 [Kitasatospora herbaricolor]|nr:hypothetical protein GCM10010495_77700 [Kitasatospora herbaricolor]
MATPLEAGGTVENQFTTFTTLLDRADWGDHVGLLLAPVSTRAPAAAAPPALQDVADIDAGHPA